MFLPIELLGDDIVEPEHDVAPGFIVVLDPLFNVVIVEMMLG